MFDLVPARKGTASEKDFSGPSSEINRQSDAVAVVAGENDHLFAARMVTEDRAHFFGEENRAAPAVRDAHVGKRRMQVTHAILERAEALGSLAVTNVVATQVVRGTFDGAIA